MDADYYLKDVPQHWVAGVDEAGRGPVVAAAVILDPLKPIEGLADSKVLSERKRERLYEEIKERALSWSIALATVEEIDNINILQASLLAMSRAVEGLTIQPEQVLVDGNKLPKLSMPALAIVKGDSKVQAISAASILAKVERDRLLLAYHDQYPSYAFNLHKGYGTPQHLEALARLGYLPIHRKTFNPLKTLLLQNNIKPAIID